MATEQK
jgi:hypothetical protein